MCLGLKRLSWYPHNKSNKRSVYKIEEVEREQDHGRGKPEPSGVVAVGLLGKQVPFLQRLYHCLPLWIAFFLLPLVFKQTENSQTGVFCLKRIGKKPLRLTSFEAVFILGHTEEWDGITNFHVACCFYKKIVPSFTVQVYREKVYCVTVLFRFCFFKMFYYTV